MVSKTSIALVMTVGLSAVASALSGPGAHAHRRVSLDKRQFGGFKGGNRGGPPRGGFRGGFGGGGNFGRQNNNNNNQNGQNGQNNNGQQNNQNNNNNQQNNGQNNGQNQNNNNNGQNNDQNNQNNNNNGQNQDQNNNNNNNNNNGQNPALLLQADLVQSNSATTGLEAGDQDGRVASLTDPANFVNFCAGKGATTNGLQQRGGSCNGIVMGQIPSDQRMISTIILFPQPGQDIPADQEFEVTIKVDNLNAGAFTNPDTTYYSAPQFLGQNGAIVGHTHITIQNLGGNLTPQNPPPANAFTFFKGINDAGDGNGGLKAVVTGGLPAGFYRVCTMSSSANHQPVLMPVAQRGAQDDCTKFTVGQGNQNNNNNNNNGQNQNQDQNNQNNNNNNQNNNGQNNGQNNNGQNNGQNNNGQNGQRRRGRFGRGRRSVSIEA